MTTKFECPFDKETLFNHIDEYISKEWPSFLADLSELIRIPSVLDEEKARLGAPYGPASRAALDKALEISTRMGFSCTDVDGYVACADYLSDQPSTEKHKQIGIIGHVDVVPAGPGWNFPAYELTQKDSYLIGRGVTDDKGPVLLALYALKFWKDAGAQFPHDVRIIFGANEENGMTDVDYYLSKHPEPDFLFTPDATFPVCYGEKGLYDGIFSAGPFEDASIVDFQAGSATNAVPGTAFATIRCSEADLNPAKALENISVNPAGDGLFTVSAQGKSAHASTPELGESALAVLAYALGQCPVCSAEERAFLRFLASVAPNFSGRILGINTEDVHFGELTAVIGTASMEEGRILLSFDSRYPTSTTAGIITDTIREFCDNAQVKGLTFTCTDDVEPFLLDPESPAVQALLTAYNTVTGEQLEPFTMGGGTYARKFKNAVSFGPKKPWVETPDFIGSMHGPDEGVSEDLWKEALGIYIYTIAALMEQEL